MLKLFDEIDKDKNGELDFKEFSEAMLKFDDSLSGIELEKVFKYFDKAEKGVIKLAPFISILNES